MKRSFLLLVFILSSGLTFLPHAKSAPPEEYIEVEDKIIEESIKEESLIEKLDITPPTGSILINNNDAYTNTIDVTLTLSAQDNPGGTGVSKMKFSNDGVNWSVYETYAATKSWTYLCN